MLDATRIECMASGDVPVKRSPALAAKGRRAQPQSSACRTCSHGSSAVAGLQPPGSTMSPFASITSTMARSALADFQPRRRLGLASAILLSVGGLLMVVWLGVTWPTLAFVVSARPVRAIFVGAVAHSGGNYGGTFLYPQFRFTTPAGQVVTFTGSSGSTGQPYTEGQAVKALYDPQNPTKAQRDGFFDLWAGSAFAGVLAAFPLVLGVLFLFLNGAKSTRYRVPAG